MSTDAQLKKRKSEIVAQLCKLAHDGWRNAVPDEYRDLETQLAKINYALARRIQRRGEQK